MQNSIDNNVIIYTDGACKGNPGIGGWGAVLIYKQHEKHIYGYEQNTTNNRMEIMAVIMALKCLKKSSNIKIYTDSKYVQQAMLSWIDNWRKNNWRTSNNKPVKNIELWQELILYTEKHNIEWQWVKGHSGDKYNELADNLANQAISQSLIKQA